MWWPAGLAILALGLASVAPRPYDDGGLGTLTFTLIHTVGLPFFWSASFVARQLGPGKGDWIWPLAIPLGLLYYFVADWVVQRIARRRSQTRVVAT
jgi:hypothetical protein